MSVLGWARIFAKLELDAGLALAELLRPSIDLSGVTTHVVFVHGLRGDKEESWRSTGASSDFWPRWLESDIPGIAAWSVGYPAPATRWRDSSMPLTDRAENVLEYLTAEPGLASGRIAFVAHSLGGLVVMQILRSADRDAGRDSMKAAFLRRIRKVAFLATPHLGSGHAVFGDRLRIIARPSEASLALLRNAPQLRDLNRWYRSYSTEHGIEHLTLYETRPTGLLGMIVKPDSADPGLPDAKLIPIDADHRSICKPQDRNSEIYVHIRDFLERPATRVHGSTLIASSISDLSARMEHDHERLGDGITALQENLDRIATLSIASTPTGLVDAETNKRLSILRRSRFLAGADSIAGATRLADDLIKGELDSASKPLKLIALAWCARLLSLPSTVEEAERALDAARGLGESEEVTIARAFCTAARDGKAAALAQLAGLGTAQARSASFIIASRNMSETESIRWLQEAGLSFLDLDPDGKLFLIQRYLLGGAWVEALTAATSLAEADYEQTPALLWAAAMAHLVQAVPNDLRPQILQSPPINGQSFPLAADDTALAHRRDAQKLFERATVIASDLGCGSAANHANDLALWLALRDPTGAVEARKVLDRSMGEPAHSLRRLPLALQFGLRLDLVAVEQALNNQTALSGGKSVDAAIARLAMAMTQSDPRDAAAYVGMHRTQLVEYYDPQAIDALEIEMLARSGQTREAEARLAALEQKGLAGESARKLRQAISESTGTNPVEAREKSFSETGELIDLMMLTDILAERKEWKKLAHFGKILFDQTRSLAHVELFVQALVETREDDRLIALLRDYPELLDQSDLLMTAYSWALYRIGDLKAAAKALWKLKAKRDNPNDRSLTINLAIASGDWHSLPAFIEGEWEKRNDRSAAELLQAGQLAQQLRSARGGELIREAARKGAGDPRILIGCYLAACAAGWEDDPEVASWLHRAVELSGDAGPIQRASIKEILARHHDWRRHASETWGKLAAGEIPVFGAAHLLDRSLAEMCLAAALLNTSETDVRKRALIFSFSGARPIVTGPFKTIAIEATALLTLGFLGLTEKALNTFDRVFIPHLTLGWLMDERRRIEFHQPSRVRDARQLLQLIESGAVQRFEVPIQVDPSLAADVGGDLAAMLGDAQIEDKEPRQRVVVRPYPVHRIDSLLEEPADLAQHHRTLRGCLDVVDALKRLGHLTAAEEERARAYLALHERPWPQQQHIESGAILYLDGLALRYLQHLKLLQKLGKAGFDVLVCKSDIAEANALIRYDSLTAEVATVIEEIRSCLARGIEAGAVRLGRLTKREGDDLALLAHPTMAVLDLYCEVDAVVVDDRFVNQHHRLSPAPDSPSVLSTIDLLKILQSRDIISHRDLGEYRTRLRQGGLILVPLDPVEVSELLTACPVVDGALLETAELKAVRESVLSIRMTDVLQLPEEVVWLDRLFRTWMDLLRAQWQEGIEVSTAIARSNWILKLLDFRGWSHRLPTSGGHSDEESRYLAQLRLLISLLDEQPAPVQAAYWRWLEVAVLSDIKSRQPELYDRILADIERTIDECVAGFEAKGPRGAN